MSDDTTKNPQEPQLDVADSPATVATGKPLRVDLPPEAQIADERLNAVAEQTDVGGGVGWGKLATREDLELARNLSNALQPNATNTDIRALLSEHLTDFDELRSSSPSAAALPAPNFPPPHPLPEEPVVPVEPPEILLSAPEYPLPSGHRSPSISPGLQAIEAEVLAALGHNADSILALDDTADAAMHPSPPPVIARDTKIDDILHDTAADKPEKGRGR